MRRIDAALVGMVLIWGVNYSVIKRAFSELPPQQFNSIRLMIASAVFLAAIAYARRHAREAAVSGGRTLSSVFFTASDVTARDWFDLVWLGLVGHFAYQYCFVGGVNQTSVSNAALIIGATPVGVAVMSAVFGRERISALHWLGVITSITGLYFVVGHGAEFGGKTFQGDLLVLTSVSCWTAYTLGATRLIARHSPLFVTGMTMALGMVPYVTFTIPALMATDWSRVSAWTWIAVVLSALLALNVAYLTWYTGVQKIGPARTSMYSNLVPIVAMTVAALWLGEPLGAAKLIGATAVLGGVVLTRLGRKPAVIPIEE
jgi:drug/metabolite transporter (DMT)-like permease